MRSITLTPPEVELLFGEVISQNLTQREPTNPYEILRIKENDIFFTLFNTGKLVFQESEHMEHLFAKILLKKEHSVIGTDEAGKGEWYGPLVVAGVALTPQETITVRKMGVGDSKELSSVRIHEIAQFLQQSVKTEVKSLNPEEYDSRYEEFRKQGKNLNDLLTWAHTEVIRHLLQRVEGSPEVVIDQFDARAPSKKMEGEWNVTVTYKIGGESETAVASASVLAKSIFEKEVENLNAKYDIDLRNTAAEDVSPVILPHVAKLHFRNVKKASSPYQHTL